MFNRIVSLLLVAVILACPMRCGRGICHAGQCCSQEKSSRHSCAARGADPCQCNGSSHEDTCSESSHADQCNECNKSSRDNDRSCPNQPPAKPSCQGVCGGAVVQKPNEFREAADSFFVPMTDTAASLIPRMVECKADGVVRYCHFRSGNYGRSLRALHMSFLC